MHRRDILLGGLGLALSVTASANANAQLARQTNTRLATLTDYPALRAYVESLRPISAGTFQRLRSTGDSDEKPNDSIALSSFRLGAAPVGFGVWKEYCAATGTALPDAPLWGILDDHPVVNVSWNDIMGVDGNGGFCKWASAVSGLHLTLPTQVQFEYAACGSQSGVECPFVNTFCNSSSCSMFNAPVTLLSDMSGTLWQWCSDQFGTDSVIGLNDTNGTSSSFYNKRCVRGGSWLDHQDPFLNGDCFRDPDWRGSFTGFRLSAGPG
jgi:formylglycine-generating enzyme required for sulfatase activity